MFPKMGILTGVINMKTNPEILSSILKTTQMGQVGIRSVQDKAVGTGLQKALESQLKEYDSIETQAHALASQRGWQLPELQAGVRLMSDMASRMKLSYGQSDSKIADMMILGNTRGMVKGLKNMHHWSEHDSQIENLSQKLIETEVANIRQMQPFL